MRRKQENLANFIYSTAINKSLRLVFFAVENYVAGRETRWVSEDTLYRIGNDLLEKFISEN